MVARGRLPRDDNGNEIEPSDSEIDAEGEEIDEEEWPDQDQFEE